MKNTEQNQAEPIWAKPEYSSSEKALQTATISNDTRLMIIAFGKIADASQMIGNAVNGFWGESNHDDMMKDYYTKVSEINTEILKLIGITMEANMNELSPTEI